MNVGSYIRLYDTFVGDVTPTNLRNYIRQFHVIDECTGPGGRAHVSPYVIG
jgi:hypothetical protein